MMLYVLCINIMWIVMWVELENRILIIRSIQLSVLNILWWCHNQDGHRHISTVLPIWRRSSNSVHMVLTPTNIWLMMMSSNKWLGNCVFLCIYQEVHSSSTFLILTKSLFVAVAWILYQLMSRHLLWLLHLQHRYRILTSPSQVGVVIFCCCYDSNSV